MTLLALALLLAAAEPLRLPPVDSCAADPSFAAYRSELRAAIARKDREAMLAAAADDIVIDFGGGAGRAAFAKAWRLDAPQSSPLWTELEAVLELGCTKDGDALVAPSLFAQLPEEADAFESLLAVKPGTALRSRPQDDAPAVAPLDWHLLTLDGDTEDGWMHASLPDGRSGYIRREHVRSPLDYRAHFRKIGGRWRITSVVAGD